MDYLNKDGIGFLFILFGLGILLMAIVNLTANALPPQAKRFEEIERKKLANEELSLNEKLEDKQGKFESKLLVIGIIFLITGLILIFTK